MSRLTSFVNSTSLLKSVRWSSTLESARFSSQSVYAHTQQGPRDNLWITPVGKKCCGEQCLYIEPTRITRGAIGALVKDFAGFGVDNGQAWTLLNRIRVWVPKRGDVVVECCPPGLGSGVAEVSGESACGGPYRRVGVLAVVGDAAAHAFEEGRQVVAVPFHKCAQGWAKRLRQLMWACC